jgi:hypothetical protein
MTPAIEPKYRYAAVWLATGLGYPVRSVVVGVARDLDGRAKTGRDEDRAR